MRARAGVGPAARRGEWAAVAVAGAVAAGAWVARPVPWPAVVVAVVVGVGAAWAPRRLGALAGAVAVAVAGAVLASALGARAWADLRPPPRAPFEGEVALVADPTEAFGAVRAEVRAGDGRRCEATAWGGPAAALRPRLAGEAVWVRGRVEPLDAPRLAVRHVACRLVVDEVGAWSPGAVPARLANGLRATLARGAEVLPPDLAGLLAGVVLGDTRGQPPEVADDFRAAGLAHLLVVSGQNVAFALACAAPVLGRLPSGPRLAATLALLAFFALLTRFEPSVLRATAMAALAALGAALGRPASGLRLLAGAVVALVLVDPFLVRSLGFALSVAASGAIVALAGPVATALPGPGWLARPLGVVVAAQAGVAPLLVPAFGGVPLASIPANLLAGPASGVAVVWGLTAGLAAGVVGGPLAWLLHLPTRMALGWVATVARVVPAAVPGEVGPAALVVGTGAAVLAVVAGRRRRAVRAGAGLVVAAAVVVAPVAGRPALDPGRHDLGGAGTVWVGGGGPGRPPGRVLVLAGGAGPEAALAALRAAGVGRLDLVVSPSGGAGAARVVAALGRRVAVGQVWAPAGHRVAGATTPPRGAVAGAGGLVVRVGATGPRLEVDVEVAGAGVEPPPGGV